MSEELGEETVTVKRSVIVVDPRDNSETRDWSSATLVDVHNCMVQPFKMSNKLVVEDNNEREFTRSFVRVWMPSDTDIRYTDRLVWRGIEMDVFGDPGILVDFDGNVDHIQVLGSIRRG